MGTITDKEFGNLISDMVVIVDTREKKNEHIVEFLTKSGIPFKLDKLDHGDYTVEFSKPEHFKYNRCVAIERKNSFDEICGNLTKNRDRFEREFERAKNHKTKMHLLIENATWKKAFNSSFRSKMTNNALVAGILTFSIRYNCNVWYTTKDESGMLIYKLFFYTLRELSKS